MSVNKYLDYSGVVYLWDKIKNYVSSSIPIATTKTIGGITTLADDNTRELTKSNVYIDSSGYAYINSSSFLRAVYNSDNGDVYYTNDTLVPRDKNLDERNFNVLISSKNIDERTTIHKEFARSLYSQYTYETNILEEAGYVLSTLNTDSKTLGKKIDKATGSLVDTGGSRTIISKPVTLRKDCLYLLPVRETIGSEKSDIDVFCAELLVEDKEIPINYSYTYSEDGKISTATADYDTSLIYKFTESDEGKIITNTSGKIINNLPTTRIAKKGSYIPLVTTEDIISIYGISTSACNVYSKGSTYYPYFCTETKQAVYSFDSSSFTYSEASHIPVAKYGILNEINKRKANKSTVAKLDTRIQVLENQQTTDMTNAYGIEFDTTVSSPTCTRIGNLSLHATLPVQSKMKGCLLSDTGDVVEYLPSDTWVNSVRDGSSGQVMVEIPEYYRKFETEDTKRRVYISATPIAGFTRVPKMYISAYQATVDRTNLKLASVVNTTAQYRGGNNNASNDDTYKSFLGLPATSISLTNFRTYARNRLSTSYKWNCMTYEAQKTLYWLFVTEYATLNSQSDFNSELTTEGYHQGGLGAGVTNINWNSWSTYNSNFPFIPCGYTDSIGNGTSSVDFSFDTDQVTAYGSEFTTHVPRYRGIENPFGHIWQWTDGVNIRISPTEENGGDNLSKAFVCNDPSKFSSTSYDGYTYIGDLHRSNGWCKEIIFGEGGEILPATVGGGSTNYFCDYFYTSIPATETLRGLLFGGYANHGSSAGFLCASSNHVLSHSYSTVDSRLCFLTE